jgi:hypothetical protein
MALAFRHACAMGLEGIVAKRRESALSFGALAALDQGPLRQAKADL